jgi:DNA (cytosine-5)-methyltransferase 1
MTKGRMDMKVARFAMIFRPRFVVIENVQAVLRASDRVVERSTTTLRDAGYSVASGTLDLSRIGVPQTRKRHVLIAARYDTGVEAPPIEYLHDAYPTGQRTVRWAIRDLVGY